MFERHGQSQGVTNGIGAGYDTDEMLKFIVGMGQCTMVTYMQHVSGGGYSLYIKRALFDEMAPGFG